MAAISILKLFLFCYDYTEPLREEVGLNDWVYQAGDLTPDTTTVLVPVSYQHSTDVSLYLVISFLRT